MVILNQAHLRQVIKPISNLIEIAFNDRKWKASQLREVTAWCLGYKSYNHISNLVKGDILWSKYSENQVDRVSSLLYGEYHYEVDSETTSDLIDAIHRSSIETIYAATDLVWRSEKTGDEFWSVKKAIPNAITLMANAAYAEIERKPLNNSLNHLESVVGITKIQTVLSKCVNDIGEEYFDGFPHEVLTFELEEALKDANMEKASGYVEALENFNDLEGAYNALYDVDDSLSDDIYKRVETASLKLLEIKKDFWIKALRNQPSRKLVEYTFDFMMEEYGYELADEIFDSNWQSGEFISMRVVSQDSVGEEYRIKLQAWFSKYGYPLNSALIIYQVAGRIEAPEEFESEDFIDDFFGNMTDYGATLDTYYAILHGKTREISTLGYMLSEGSTISWPDDQTSHAFDSLFYYSTETREAYRAYRNYRRDHADEFVGDINTWVGNVTLVSNVHKDPCLDQFIAEIITDFNPSWRMVDEFNYPSEMGLSHERYYCIESAYVLWTVNRFGNVSINDYIVEPFRVIDDENSIVENDLYEYYQAVAKAVSSLKNVLFNVVEIKDNVCLPKFHGVDCYLKDEENYHTFVHAHLSETLFGIEACKMETVAFVEYERMSIVRQGFDAMRAANARSLARHHERLNRRLN